jgi:hypothetical protein
MNTRMSIPLPTKASSTFLPLPSAAAIILVLWLAYTGLQALIKTNHLP